MQNSNRKLAASAFDYCDWINRVHAVSLRVGFCDEWKRALTPFLVHVSATLEALECISHLSQYSAQYLKPLNQGRRKEHEAGRRRKAAIFDGHFNYNTV